MSLDEIILYVGIVMVVSSSISLTIYLIISHIKLIKLNNKMDEEYGKTIM